MVSHSKDKLLVKTKSGKIKKKPSGAIVAVANEDDRRSITSKVQNLKNGRYANLPTLQCNECPYKPIELDGTGQCKHYKKDEICYYDHKFARLYEGIDTRKVEDLRMIADEQIMVSLIELNRARIQANFEGGIPDKVADRTANNLREWMKFAYQLGAPQIRAREVQIRDKENDLVGMMREIYMEGQSNVADNKNESEDKVTFGVKTDKEKSQDAFIEMKRNREREERDLL